MKVKVRFAPSPTGALHIGGVRTALFNYLFAKKHGGEFLLRIEDTDKHRFVAGAEKYIIDSLAWCGISPDDGVNADGTAKYRQSEREYRSYADRLIARGDAYYAFDTKDELDAMRKSLEDAGSSVQGYSFSTRMFMKNSFTLSVEEVKLRIDSGNPYVIRFNTPANTEIKFIDSVKGEVSFNSNSMDDKVLFKSDGLPTYHLANVVDDHLMEITHVIRGDEWLSSAPLHILLYKAFGWDKPEFCHLPLILGPDGKKLSKRHGDKYGFPVFPMTWDYVDEEGKDVHITGFKDENYEPDALLNFLVLLGWNPGNDKEIMAVDEMISLFDITAFTSCVFKTFMLINSVFVIQASRTSSTKIRHTHEGLYICDSIKVIITIIILII
jgi:glutamyl-tRNA synthetase